MIALTILAAVFATGMILMIFDSFNLLRIFKKSSIHVDAPEISETKMFFRAAKR